MTQFQHIPTTIITGFLGAGKTTSILALMSQRPAHERWAVIVNEFGQVGIDGDLLRSEGVAIKEIPGGCLCCVGSQSFSVGLNQIIRTAKPDRILIEPTGLGHPAKLIENLRSDYFSSVIDLGAVITLVDARQLHDSRYTRHETFIDQIEVADILVANKVDTYNEDDFKAFYELASRMQPPKQKLLMVEHGRLLLEMLDEPASKDRKALFAMAHSHQHELHEDHEDTCSETGWLRLDGRGDGYVSIGWQINPVVIFDAVHLQQWLTGLQDELSLERIKGVMHTNEGWLGINLSRYEKSVTHISASSQSRLEIITGADSLPDSLDHQLQALQIQE